MTAFLVSVWFRTSYAIVAPLCVCVCVCVCDQHFFFLMQVILFMQICRHDAIVREHDGYGDGCHGVGWLRDVSQNIPASRPREPDRR